MFNLQVTVETEPTSDRRYLSVLCWTTQYTATFYNGKSSYVEYRWKTAWSVLARSVALSPSSRNSQHSFGETVQGHNELVCLDLLLRPPVSVPRVPLVVHWSISIMAHWPREHWAAAAVPGEFGDLTPTVDAERQAAGWCHFKVFAWIDDQCFLWSHEYMKLAKLGMMHAWHFFSLGSCRQAFYHLASIKASGLRVLQTLQPL